jgi:hypothetical protein
MTTGTIQRQQHDQAIVRTIGRSNPRRASVRPIGFAGLYRNYRINSAYRNNPAKSWGIRKPSLIIAVVPDLTVTALQAKGLRFK